MRWRRAIMPLLLLLLVAGGAGLWLYGRLPEMVESRLIEAVAKATGCTAMRLAVRSIRPHGADLADIAMGEAAAPFLEISSLRLDYGPGSLRRGRVDTIAISGLTLRGRLEDGKLTVPGLDWQRLVAGPQGDRTTPAAPLFAPPVRRVICRDGLLLISRGPAIIRLPFFLELTFDPAEGVATGELHLRPAGAEIGVEGRFDPAGHGLDLTLTAEVANLATLLEPVRPRSVTPPAALADLVGGVTLRGRAGIDVATRRLVSGQLDGELARLNLPIGPARLTGGGDEPFAGRPGKARLHLRGNGDTWHTEITNLTVRAGRVDMAAELTGELRLAAGAWQFSTLLSLRPPAGAPENGEVSVPPPVIALLAPRTVEVLTRGEVTRQGEWQADLTARLKGEEGAADDGMALRLRYPSGGPVMDLAIDLAANLATGSAATPAASPLLTVTAGGRGFAAEATWEARLARVRVAGEDLHGVIDALELSGTGRLQRDAAAASFSWQGETILRAAAFSGLAGGLELAIPAPRLEFLASDENGGAAAPLVAATLDFKGGTLKGQDAELAAADIGVTLPLTWPLDREAGSAERPGAITIAGLRWRQLDLGPLALTIRRQGRNFVVSGSHDSLVLPGVRLLATGEAVIDKVSGPRGEMRFSIPSTAFPAIDLGIFDPALAGLALQGNLLLTAAVSAAPGDLSASLDLKYTGGRISLPEQELSIEGVNFGLLLPELPRLTTPPQQSFSFDRGSFGKLRFGAAEVNFKLESSRSLFIEQAGADWSRGRVSLHSIRIDPAKRQYHFTLYCDRLNLAAVLEQFGVEGVDGDGTVNGFIPVRFDEERIWFDNGYLYSSPGQGGSIRVQGTDILAAGIPADSPQMSQVDFASQALKGFTYKWAKVSFDTDGDELVLGLQLDGEPEHLLPFLYRPEKNVFVRLEPGESGGIKQPILLDVNFRLPLDRILGYNKGLKNLMDRLKR